MGRRDLIKDNARQAVRILLNRMKIKFNVLSLNWFFFHPHFPSMFAFSQLFDRLNLSHAVIKITPNDLYELPKPFLTHFISDGGGFFMVVEDVDDNNVKFINEKGHIENYPKGDFLAKWTGVVAIFDPIGIEKEEDFFQSKVKEFIAKYRRPFWGVMVGLLFLMLFLINGIDRHSILSIGLIITKLAGLLVSSILLIQTFDEQNPLFNKICSSANKRLSCSSILNSKGAKLLGVFSWSEIGFIYFLTVLLHLTISPSTQTVTTASLMSIIATPYIVYSLFYQKYIAQSWCKLCLFVQAILLIDVIQLLIFGTRFDTQFLFSTSAFYLIFIGFLVTGSYSMLKPLLEAWVTNRIEIPKLKKIKYDSEVFRIMQSRNRSINIPLGELNPIVLGTANAEHQITMISNPLCQPCQKAHRNLFHFLKYKKNTVYHEIFSVDITEEESYQTALYMLHLQKSLSTEDFQQELEHFYEKHTQSPINWRARFTNINMDDLDIEGQLNKQIEWCKRQKINSTPLVIYNNRVLSDFYTLEDLDYFLE